MNELKFLSGYPEPILLQVQKILTAGQLGNWLQQRYQGQEHAVKNDKALYQFTMALKNQYLKSSAPVAKVMFDNKINVIKQALGLHTSISRVQGGKLKAKAEIRIAALFKDAPAPFLKMIVVHELAHLREKDHNKAFYQLCEYMEPAYHQLELDLRLYLTQLELHGALQFVNHP